jgi:hypothetical protein
MKLVPLTGFNGPVEWTVYVNPHLVAWIGEHNDGHAIIFFSGRKEGLAVRQTPGLVAERLEGIREPLRGLKRAKLPVEEE